MRKLKKNLPFILILLFFVLATGLLIGSKKIEKKNLEKEKILEINENLPTKNIEIAGKTLKVELATTEKKRAIGLSGRKSLAEDTGMLFVFQNPEKNYFWMQEMNFPIDILWFDENSLLIFIKENALPESYPKTFGPETKSLYVLEVRAGFSQKNNLKIGEKFNFLP